MNNKLPTPPSPQDLASIGLHYGKSFQPIQQLWIGQEEVIAELHSEEDLACLCHPQLLDGCFQALLAPKPKNTPPEEVYLPTSIARFILHAPFENTVRMHGKITERSEDCLSADISIFAPNGALLATVEEFKAKKATQAQLKHLLVTEENAGDWSYQIDWQPKPHHASTNLLENATSQLKETWLLFSLRNLWIRPVTMTSLLL